MDHRGSQRKARRSKPGSVLRRHRRRRVQTAHQPALLDVEDLLPPHMNVWMGVALALACVYCRVLRNANKAVMVKDMHASVLKAVRSRVRHLVFGGGGFKGIAFVEVLKGLADGDHTTWFRFASGLRTVSGVSVGAITAAAVAVGATPWQVEDLITRTDASAITQWGGLDAMTHMALLNPVGLVHTIKKVLRRFASDTTITFRQVRERYGRRLRIYVANLSKQRLEVLDDITAPDTKVWFAVKMSCSLPPYFPPIKWHGDLYIDGGIFRHSPGIGEPGLNPHSTLFLYLREPVTTDLNWVDYIMLLKSSIQNAQTILTRQLFPEYEASTITTTASRTTLSLLTAELGETRQREIKRDGRGGVQAFLRLPTFACVVLREVAALRRSRVNTASGHRLPMRVPLPFQASEPAMLLEALGC